VEAADGLSATPLVQMPPSSTAAIAEPGAGEFGSAVREQAPQRLPRMLRALRHADFRYFWFGNFLSNIGTWMQNVAQGWLVLDLSNSAWWLGVIGFAASAPMLLFTLFGGAIADNVNKRRLLMVTQSAMMVLAFVMAALAYWKEITVAQIAELAFLNGTAMALNTPSYQALYPALLPREDLGNAIALNSAQFNMSRVLGPTLGGFAMAWIGVSGNFFLNGLSFLAVLVALARIHYPEEQRRSEASIWQRLGEGFRYVFGSDAMRALTLLVSVASLLAIPYITFIPLFARDILGVGERGLGILMAFSGIGAFAGAVVVAQSRRESGRGRVILLMGCAFYAAVIAFCLSRNFLLSGVLQAAAGFCMIVMVAHLNTLMQHLASDEMRGRVMSIYATAFLGLAPLGSLVAGSLSHRFGAPLALGGMNALALIGSLLVYANSPALRKLQ
jgi:MFS family permease